MSVGDLIKKNMNFSRATNAPFLHRISPRATETRSNKNIGDLDISVLLCVRVEKFKGF